MNTPLNREQWLATCATLAQTYESTMNDQTGSDQRMSGQHTPGPWEAVTDAARPSWVWVAPADWHTRVCRVTLYAGEEEEQQANARLIAASPRLLAALEEVADYLDRYADVIDGDDGQPEANDAMRLLTAVTDVIAAAK